MTQFQRHRAYRRIWAAALFVASMVAGLLLTTSVVQATALRQLSPDTPQDQPVAIYFFWGDGCPHCAEAEPFLHALTQQYPNAELRAYEVWYVESNREIFARMAAAYGFEPSGVPTIFIGDQYWIGYADVIADEIAATVASCTATGCRDAGVGIIPGIMPSPTASPATPTPTTLPQAAAPLPAAGANAVANQVESAAATTTDRLELPLVGTVDLATQSLATSTALIAFVDGFNPCSLWVLSMLLALTLHTGSRTKTFLIGLVFLTVTSLIYALFITGLFTFFSVVGFLGWIQGVVALVALFFAVVNIKDYFWYKEGISFTIADSKKPGIYRRMRAVLDAGNSTWGLLGATVVLSAGVSLVEFSCTAGFPILWTNLLTAHQATAATFVLLLLLYMAIYQVDELGIFLVAVMTLKSRKLEESQGRILKLIGGMLMLTLALVMLLDPSLMSRLSTSLVVFVTAFAAAGVVLLAHRVIMPRLGLYVGTEIQPPQPHHPHKRTHRRKH